MHICFLTSEYPPVKHGGIGSFVKMLAESLVRMGHRVSVVGVYPREHCGRTNINGVSVFRLPANLMRVVRVFYNGYLIQRALDEINQEHPIDLVEAPEGGFGFARKKVPYVKLIRMHGGHHFFSVTLGSKPAPLRAWIEKRSFARADVLCAVSQYVADTTRNLLNVPPSVPIHVLTNSIETDVFRPLPSIEEELGLVVFWGTLVEKKGIFQLVEAMKEVAQQVSNARLWIIGRDRRDPVSGQMSSDKLRNLIRAKGLDASVSLKGGVDRLELPAILSKAQVVALPSHMEAMPVAWLEAMAMGKAIVASRTGPGPELIDDGVTGLLCDPYDPSSIAQQIIRLLKDPELRASLGREARKVAVERYSLDKLAKKNEEFYRHVLEQHRR